MKEFTFRKFAGLQPTILPKNNFFTVFSQGFSLLYFFPRTTFEWLLLNFCFYFCLFNTNKKKIIKITISKSKISVIFKIFNSQNFHNSFFFGNFVARMKEKFITLSFPKTGVLILAFICDILGRVFSRSC